MIGQNSSTISGTNPQSLSHSNIYKSKIGTQKHHIQKINSHLKSRIMNIKLKTNKLLYLSKSQNVYQTLKNSKSNQKLKYNFFKKAINKSKSNSLKLEFRFSNKNNLTKKKTNKIKDWHIQTSKEIKNKHHKLLNSYKESN